MLRSAKRRGTGRRRRGSGDSTRTRDFKVKIEPDQQHIKTSRIVYNNFTRRKCCHETIIEKFLNEFYAFENNNGDGMFKI